MSLLLDALKRSEAEREQTLESRLGRSGPAPAVVRRRAPWLVAIIVLVCVNAGLVTLWIRGGTVSARESVSVAEPSGPPLEAAPARRPDVRSLAHAAALGSRGSAPRQPHHAAPHAAQRAHPGRSAPRRAPARSAQADADQTAPPLDTLPQTVKRQLPELHMQIHVYAPDPADRFVMINMQHAAEGDVLPSGVKVVQIRPDGVVLGFRGRSFLLPTHSP
jgi:general secretion pathway protein B